MKKLEEKFLEEKLTGVLEGLLEMWKPPFYFAMIGSNGCTLIGQYFWQGEGLGCEASGFTKEVMTSPVNIMFVNSSGDAARVIISKDDLISKPKLFN